MVKSRFCFSRRCFSCITSFAAEQWQHIIGFSSLSQPFLHLLICPGQSCLISIHSLSLIHSLLPNAVFSFGYNSAPLDPPLLQPGPHYVHIPGPLSTHSTPLFVCLGQMEDLAMRRSNGPDMTARNQWDRINNDAIFTLA